jgi:hypothetical protein
MLYCLRFSSQQHRSSQSATNWLTENACSGRQITRTQPIAMNFPTSTQASGVFEEPDLPDIIPSRPPMPRAHRSNKSGVGGVTPSLATSRRLQHSQMQMSGQRLGMDPTPGGSSSNHGAAGQFSTPLGLSISVSPVVRARSSDAALSDCLPSF